MESLAYFIFLSQHFLLNPHNLWLSSSDRVKNWVTGRLSYFSSKGLSQDSNFMHVYFFQLKYSWFTVFQLYSEEFQLYLQRLPLQYSKIQNTSHMTETYTLQSPLVHFSVVYISLWSHGLQHARILCQSPTPRDFSNSCLLSQWCHPTIPFSSCLQSSPASGYFPMSQIFTSDSQSIEASASASVLPVNIQGLFPLGLTGLISLQSKHSSKTSII